MTTSTTDTTQAEKGGFFQRNKIWLIVILLFALSNGGIYLYQKFQQKKVLKACRELLDSQNKIADTLVSERTEEIGMLLNRTLAWGIRGEMERGNRELIDLYLNKMVQETGLDLVMVENARDSIYLSTDKKYENQRVREVLPIVQGAIDRPRLLASDLNSVTMAAPIFGTELRLGTLFMVYKTNKATLARLDQMHSAKLPGEEGDKGREKAK